MWKHATRKLQGSGTCEERSKAKIKTAPKKFFSFHARASIDWQSEKDGRDATGPAHCVGHRQQNSNKQMEKILCAVCWLGVVFVRVSMFFGMQTLRWLCAEHRKGKRRALAHNADTWKSVRLIDNGIEPITEELKMILEALATKVQRPNAMSVCVCVCVLERKRERGKTAIETQFELISCNGEIPLDDTGTHTHTHTLVPTIVKWASAESSYAAAAIFTSSLIFLFPFLLFPLWLKGREHNLIGMISFEVSNGFRRMDFTSSAHVFLLLLLLLQRSFISQNPRHAGS